MGKMAEIDYENQKKDVDGTKIVKKEEGVKKEQTNNDTKRLEQIESNLKVAGKTIDKLNDSMKRMSSLLNQVANRMGLK